MCSKIHHLNLVKFLSAPGLAWQETLKKTEVQIEFLTDMMVEKGYRWQIWHAIHQYANN